MRPEPLVASPGRCLAAAATLLVGFAGPVQDGKRAKIRGGGYLVSPTSQDAMGEGISSNEAVAI